MLNNRQRVFTRSLAAKLVLQNNKMATVLVFQKNPLVIEVFSYVNAFFCSNKFTWILATLVKTLYSLEKHNPKDSGSYIQMTSPCKCLILLPFPMEINVKASMITLLKDSAYRWTENL